MRSHGLTQALAKAGGPSKLARLIGVTPQAVSQWRDVPVGQVLAVERETGVSRKVLLPDLYAAAVEVPTANAAEPQASAA